MKGLLWLLAAFALAVALSLAMRANDGYALFVLHPWRVEISLNLLAILLLAVFVAGYLIVGVVLKMVRLPSHVRAFRARRHETQGRGAVLGAIQALFEGRFGRAEKFAARACDLGVAPALASLIAARAAQRMRNFERRDQWLERAKAYDSDWRLARQVVTAELLLEERRFDEARAVLRELHASGPKHIATLTLLLRAEQGLGNWSEVIRLAKLLEGRGAMPAEAIEGIRVKACIALLSRKTHDPADLARLLREIPESGRAHPKVAAAAARAFMQLGDCRSAQRLIGEALEREWSGELVLLYGECTKEDALDRIERAERWLRERPDDAELLLTLGRLCVQRELWGKAQNYLEASLTLQPTPAAHVALASLFDRIGRTEEANRHYRAGADAGVATQAGR